MDLPLGWRTIVYLRKELSVLGFIPRTLHLSFRPPTASRYDLSGTEDLEAPTRRCRGVSKSFFVYNELKVTVPWLHF